MRVHLDRETPWRETLRPKGTEVAIEQKRLQQLAPSWKTWTTSTVLKLS